MKWLCKKYFILNIDGVESLTTIEMQNGCSKHHPGGQLWEVWPPSWGMWSEASVGSSSRVCLPVTLAHHGSFWVEHSRMHHQVGCDLVRPTWQCDFSLCPILLLCSSLHRFRSLINILTPNSVRDSAWASHSEWGSADSTGKFRPRNCRSLGYRK